MSEAAVSSDDKSETFESLSDAPPKPAAMSLISTASSESLLANPRVSRYLDAKSIAALGQDVSIIIDGMSKREASEVKRKAKDFALQALKNLKSKVSDDILENLAKAPQFNGDTKAAQKHLRDKVVSEAVFKYIRHYARRKLEVKQRSASMPAHILSEATGRPHIRSSDSAPAAASPRPHSTPARRVEVPLDYDCQEFRPKDAKGEVVMEGFLTKLATRQFSKPGGGDRKNHTNWKKRYFRLIQCKTNVLLAYYVDGSLQELKGEFTFTAGLAVKMCPKHYYPKRNHVFQVTNGNGPRCIVKFIGCAVDNESAQQWVETIQKSVHDIPALSREDEF